MGIGNIIMPDAGRWLGYSPFAAGPTPASFISAATLASQITALGGSGLLFTAKDLALAQIQSLNTVPVTMIAGVAGAIIVPVYWTFHDVRGSIAFNGTPTLSLRYAGVATDIALGIAMIAGATVAPGQRFSLAAQAQGAFAQNWDAAALNPRGSAIQLRSNTDVTGGGVGGSWRCTIAYGLIAGLL